MGGIGKGLLRASIQSPYFILRIYAYGYSRKISRVDRLT